MSIDIFTTASNQFRHLTGQYIEELRKDRAGGLLEIIRSQCRPITELFIISAVLVAPFAETVAVCAGADVIDQSAAAAAEPVGIVSR